MKAPKYFLKKYEPLFQTCSIQKNCSYCTKKEENPWDWSWIDAIYCICLIDRDDRFQNSEKLFHQYGLCSKVIYYRAEKPTEKEFSHIKNIL